VTRSDGIEINAQADIERWHRLNADMAGELAAIPGQVSWVNRSG
jgi:hypothetical protein